ncbi:hypothetical protein EKD04_012940 [Chloroflexales bacterium ZM16-3]|nr:hypothetical protein [Chloroflexales bacterium ZM16-3]
MTRTNRKALFDTLIEKLYKEGWEVWKIEMYIREWSASEAFQGSIFAYDIPTLRTIYRRIRELKERKTDE